MAVDVDDLAAALGFPDTPPDSQEDLQRALDTAMAVIQPQLLDPLAYQDPSGLTSQQQQALDLSTLTVAGDLWRRKDAPGGQYLFADNSDYPTTLPRDPLITVWSWLVEAGLANGQVIA